MDLRGWLFRHGLSSPRVFISFRRSDAGGYANHLKSDLANFYGSEPIFLDHDSIAGGVDFEKALPAALDAATVFLAVIGPDWLDAKRNGRRRLDEPNDWVRREIEVALERPGLRVIPVLVGNADLPTQDQLPESIQRLPSRQVRTIRPDRNDDDVKNLIKTIGGWRRWIFGLPLYAWASVAAVLIVAGFVLVRVITTTDLPPDVPERDPITVNEGSATEIDLLSGVTDDHDGLLTVAVDGKSDLGGSLTDHGGGRVTYEPPQTVIDTRDRIGDTAAPYLDQFGYSVHDEALNETSRTMTVSVVPGPMTGDFRIAIAQFSTRDGVEADTERLATTVFELIHDQLVELNVQGEDFAIRSPRSTGVIAGSSAAERAASAQAVAEEMDADIVVYGQVTGDGFAPVFLIRNRAGHFDGAEELTGQHEAGLTVLSSDLGTAGLGSREVRLGLTGRMRALTHFVRGLAFYADQQFDAAAEAFEDAAIEPDPLLDGAPVWRLVDGKQVLLLFQGNTAGKLAARAEAEETTAEGPEMYRAADAFFRDALAADEAYARALVGRGEVAYHLGRSLSRTSSCDPGKVDPSLLREAEDLFFQAMASPGKPPLAAVEEKASIGLGRVYYCLSRAEEADLWGDAVAAYQLVADRYERGDLRLAGLAYHAYLGLAESTLPRVGDAPVQYCVAIAHYMDAERLSPTPDAASAIAARREFLEGRLETISGSCV